MNVTPRQTLVPTSAPYWKLVRHSCAERMGEACRMVRPTLSVFAECSLAYTGKISPLVERPTRDPNEPRNAVIAPLSTFCSSSVSVCTGSDTTTLRHLPQARPAPKFPANDRQYLQASICGDPLRSLPAFMCLI